MAKETITLGDLVVNN